MWGRPAVEAVVAVLVVGLPVCYQLNARVTPWAGGRLAPDGDRYVAFWTSNTVLHWASAFVVVGVVRWSDAAPAAFGLGRPHHVATAVSGAAFVAAAVYYYRAVVARPPLSAAALRRAGDFWTPATRQERLLGVFTLAVTPGVCEEVVYRGFMISALRSAGASVPVAVGVATVSFVLLHGRGATASAYSFAWYAGFGVVFAGLFLRFGTVWPGVALHAAYNLYATARDDRRYVEGARRDGDRPAA